MKHSTVTTGWLLIALLMPMVTGRATEGSKLTPAERQFFERNIRPVLSEQCYSCHSHQPDAKVRSGLALDTREGLLAGGDTGPAIVPGKPGQSLLLDTLKGKDPDLLMPPEKSGGPLPTESIAAFEEWIRMGAPDPRTSNSTEGKLFGADEQKAGQHPFFQPVRPVPLPPVSRPAWVRNPVDRFILAKLDAQGMEPSPEADRRTLIRRAYWGLIGLPPSAEEVAAFVGNPAPDAFERLVEHLLKSPHYGERWGRYWLDVARYGDTMGTTIRNRENRYLHSYTYRDYVIRSFNEDKPYDRFLIEQIAADHLPGSRENGVLAGLGFLTLGNRFNNDVNQVIDDRIDVVTRGTMGLTVTCARCHDHKFDPVTMKDYYALHGVFNSSEEPAEPPLLGAPPQTAEYLDYRRQLEEREAELAHARHTNTLAIAAREHTRVADYLLAVHEFGQPAKRGELFQTAFFRARDLDSGLGASLDRHLKRLGRKPDVVWSPWLAFSGLPEKDFAARAVAVADRISDLADPKNPVHPLVARLFHTPPRDMKDVADRYGALATRIAQHWWGLVARAEQRQSDPPDRLISALEEEIRQSLFAEGAPLALGDREIRRLTSQRVDARLNLIIRKINDLEVNHPGAPPRAMALVDRANPRNSPIFLRGNAGSRGDIVKRQFLEVLGGSDEKAFHRGSGRLELAQSIAARDNPLTARVMVNRIWLHHFGSGLVATPGDFGLVGEPPSHPGLLDWLAGEFMENGWSIKHLHRVILLSATWRQSSDDNPRYTLKDQGNNLLWRQNRYRLDFEGIRDTLLAVAGTLDPTMGGRPVDLEATPPPTRRTVYAYINRADLPGIFNTFDFAPPDISSPMRGLTIVPQQALYLMNAPFVIQLARDLAARPEIAGCADPRERIQRLHLRAFQRGPSEAELKVGLSFVQAQMSVTPPEPAKPVWEYGFGAVDGKTGSLRRYTAFPQFQQGRWEGGRNLGGIQLDARGGVAGAGASRAVIRRWTAPRSDTVAIDGLLSRRGGKGPEVRGWIFSSKRGRVATFEPATGGAQTQVPRLEVERGETLDFVVESLHPKTPAAFNWSPHVRLVNYAAAERAGRNYEWLAETDFDGPPPPPLKGLDPWEKYAQVLLLANETVFRN